MESDDQELESARDLDNHAEPALGPRDGIRSWSGPGRARGRQELANLRWPGRSLGLGSGQRELDAAIDRQRVQPACRPHVRIAAHRLCPQPPRSAGGHHLQHEPSLWRIPADCFWGGLGIRARLGKVHQPLSGAELAEPALGQRHRLLSRHRQDLPVRRSEPELRLAQRPVGVGREFLVPGPG